MENIKNIRYLFDSLKNTITKISDELLLFAITTMIIMVIATLFDRPEITPWIFLIYCIGSTFYALYGTKNSIGDSKYDHTKSYKNSEYIYGIHFSDDRRKWMVKKIHLGNHNNQYIATNENNPVQIYVPEPTNQVENLNYRKI